MKKHLSIIYFFLTIIGVVGVIVTLGYDYFRPGEPDFGRYQFMGFVGSIIILLAGIRKLSSTKKNFWDFVSLLIYMAGMFYLVLMPRHYFHHSHQEMLQLTQFSTFDFSTNVIGFMPLGYLLMSLITKSSGKFRPTITFFGILLFGVLVSFLIEICQYFIPGRSSSLFDVAANGSGNLFGILLFLLEKTFINKNI